MIVLLDTHALIWLAAASEQLGAKARAAVRKAARDGAVTFSAVSFWEVATLVGNRRLDLSQSPAEFRQNLLLAGAEEIPLTGDIAVLSAGLGLHRDPADRLIAATAYAHDAVLVTADELLLEWKHPLKRQDARL